MLEHRSLVNYLSWHVEYYGMTAKDRVFANAGLAFDASMAETWPTLAVGATLYPVVDQEVRVMPELLVSKWGCAKMPPMAKRNVSNVHSTV